MYRGNLAPAEDITIVTVKHSHKFDLFEIAEVDFCIFLPVYVDTNAGRQFITPNHILGKIRAWPEVHGVEDNNTTF